MLNALALRDDGPLPSKCPIHPGNPPDLRHPRSIISQNEFANSIIPVPLSGELELTCVILSSGFQPFHILAGQECPAYRGNSFLKAVYKNYVILANLLKYDE
jgi:hypothetical protein